VYGLCSSKNADVTDVSDDGTVKASGCDDVIDAEVDRKLDKHNIIRFYTVYLRNFAYSSFFVGNPRKSAYSR